MNPSDLLQDACGNALRFLLTLPSRPACASADAAALRQALGSELSERGEDPRALLASLVQAIEPGLVANAGPRYFGFVTGGVLPVALATEWLTAAWDQNAFGHVASPAASVIEEITASWLVELFGLPEHASVGFVTGGQMANFTCLCAARGEVLRRSGVDLELTGLAHAPPITVLVSEHGHVTIHSALRMLGIGKQQIVSVAADAQGRMRADALRETIARCGGPLIVCTQAGNVNTGAFDPLSEIIPIARERGAWVHVDGAFGLWAAAHPELRTQLAGHALADSWAVDGHKWLNVPYDSGFAIVADPRAHHDAMRVGAAPYLVRAETGERDGSDWVPESSRRARAFSVYAALRSLGRNGVAELIGSCCVLARRIAEGVKREAGARILNDVVLNQVLVRFETTGTPNPEAGDVLTRRVIEHLQKDGTCWVGPTVFRGQAAMRISISNWSTTAQDVDRAIDAIAKAAAHCRRSQ